MNVIIKIEYSMWAYFKREDDVVNDVRISLEHSRL